jgi:hypothetical protein
MNTMTPKREAYGPFLIEAGAMDLQDGRHWQPWLRLAPLPGSEQPFVARAFHGLKPVFATETAAIRYAAELGRRLVDEECAPGAICGDRTAGSKTSNSVFDRAGAGVARDAALATGARKADSPLARFGCLFARRASAIDMHRSRDAGAYPGSAASLAESERHLRAIEKSRLLFAVTFPH